MLFVICYLSPKNGYMFNDLFKDESTFKEFISKRTEEGWREVDSVNVNDCEVLSVMLKVE